MNQTTKAMIGALIGLGLYVWYGNKVAGAPTTQGMLVFMGAGAGAGYLLGKK